MPNADMFFPTADLKPLPKFGTLAEYIRWCEKQNIKSVYCELPEGLFKRISFTGTASVYSAVATGPAGSVTS